MRTAEIERRVILDDPFVSRRPAAATCLHLCLAHGRSRPVGRQPIVAHRIAGAPASFAAPEGRRGEANRVRMGAALEAPKALRRLLVWLPLRARVPLAGATYQIGTAMLSYLATMPNFCPDDKQMRRVMQLNLATCCRDRSRYAI
jgi:hypothetical protein